MEWSKRTHHRRRLVGRSFARKRPAHTWAILKTYVSLALHPKRYETRLKHTVGDCNVLLLCEVHSFEKHPCCCRRGRQRCRWRRGRRLSIMASSLAPSTKKRPFLKGNNKTMNKNTHNVNFCDVRPLSVQGLLTQKAGPANTHNVKTCILSRPMT